MLPIFHEFKLLRGVKPMLAARHYGQRAGVCGNEAVDDPAGDSLVAFAVEDIRHALGGDGVAAGIAEIIP